MRQLVSENRKGVILPIASVGGISGLYTSPIYIATKHGIVGFVKSMKHLEKYEGIKIVTVCPGAVDSPFWTPEKRESTNFASIQSLKPDNIAEAMIDRKLPLGPKGYVTLEPRFELHTNSTIRAE